ncbi:MAG TPA: AI-2E family transporter, partial [Gemmatimonadaceae bacterium]|nr:AI-2E family transporter [Gemmatimonadaceae bacterium]
MTLAATAARSRVTRALLAIVAVVLVLLLLRMARAVVLPVVAGLVLAALVAPISNGLARVVPRGIALLLTVLMVTAIFLALLGAFAWSAKTMGERVLQRRERLEAVHRQLSGMAARVGMTVPPLPGAVATGEQARSGSSGSGTPAQAGGDSAGSGATGGQSRNPVQRLASGISAAALAIGFMALALAERTDARRKVRRRFSRASAERLIGITEECSAHLRRYFVVKSITSGITGAATLLVTLAFGLDFAVVWGLIAFLLEYVPTVGSILAVIPPALYAVVQFDGLARPLVIAGTLTVVQLVLGNYVDPKIEGRLLALSPLVVLFSVVFWA